MNPDNDDLDPVIARFLDGTSPVGIERHLSDEEEIEAFAIAKRLSREHAKAAMIATVMQDALKAFASTAFDAGFNFAMIGLLTLTR